MSEVNPVQPALDALHELRVDIKKRIGKEGGNLNSLLLQKLNTIEGTLLQIPSVQTMASTINQQAQLMTFTIRNMSRKELAAANGDHDPSSTKGE